MHGADLPDRLEQEERAVAEWLAGEPGVLAERTVLAAPEIWEGAVDRRSFWFRERGGVWRIELDIRPNGQFGRQPRRDPDGGYVTGPDGKWETEEFELTSGDVIARGAARDLGDTAVEHLVFIVRTVRDHLRRETCTHPDAREWCPDCGARMEGTG